MLDIKRIDKWDSEYGKAKKKLIFLQQEKPWIFGENIIHRGLNMNPLWEE